MFQTDGFYGHRTILARYAGRPDGLPIWAHLQHGWNAATGFGTKYLAGFDNPKTLDGRLPVLVWNERNRKTCVDAGLRDVHVIGAPFAYLDHLLGPGPRAEGVGTIAYPLHGGLRPDATGSAGGHLVEGGREEDAYVAALAEREDGPVTVCLYWREYERPELRRPYEEAGFQVTTHGGREDPHFLHRQREALLAHRRVVTNRVSTALWYGALLGREVEVYGPLFGSGDAQEEAWWRERQHVWWPEVHAGPVAGSEAVALGRSELGADERRDPDELARLLGWSGWRRPLAPLVGGLTEGRRRLRSRAARR